VTGDTTIYLDKNIKAARFIVGNNDYAEDEISPLLPGMLTLYQNYPNPFNPETVISFALPKTAPMRLEIFNILGQKVTTLLDRPMPAGINTVVWDGHSESGGKVSTGVYLYRLQSGSFTQTKKMLLLK
ncbi:MAG: T9SS type A sorting domain-containing protein, partial [Candidatus Zixiibacteriota bacterium]